MLTSCSLLACVASLPIPIPHYPAQLWALWMRLADLCARWVSTCSLEHLCEPDKDANLCFFILYLPRGESLLCQISNRFLPAADVPCQRICKQDCAAGLLWQWVKGRTVGNDRRLELGWNYFFWQTQMPTSVVCIGEKKKEKKKSVQKAVWVFIV